MLVGYMAYRVSIGLNYKWNWGVIPQYFFRFDGESGGWIPNLLMEGFLTTIRISVWSSILALILGIVMGLMLRAKSLYPRLIARTYVELVRNTPPLVLIFIFYFFLGNQIMTLLRVDSMVAASPEKVKTVLAVLFASENQFSAFLSALLTMAVYEGAYITEIVRAGLNSVEKGQWEAADSLGLSPWYKYRYVVLPQAVRNILPSLAGQFISTIKDSAIVSVISIQELTFQGMELMSATYRTFEVWITITLLYFVLTFLCSLGAGRLESRLHKANASS
ncbi:MAG: amino acid ABC transporter permease [Proteobacteria bacterium]|nr:amino acid ABC transporter permease [Pseudomonadota bacterium]